MKGARKNPVQAATRRAMAGIALCAAALFAAGCSPTFELVTRTRHSKPEAKQLPAPNFKLAVVETPDDLAPLVGVQVQQQKYWIETRVRIQRTFKKFEDGRYEPVEPSDETKTPMARVTGKTSWAPVAGVPVTFRIRVGETEETELKTDEQGFVRFDVSPFAEAWIEGRALTVEVVAKLHTITDPDPWAKMKGKSPNLLKTLPVEQREVLESAEVDVRTLERIFEQP